MEPENVPLKSVCFNEKFNAGFFNVSVLIVSQSSAIADTVNSLNILRP